MMRARSGLTVWELILFTIFLAIAGGSSVFFFFVNSSDVRKAQQKYEWVHNTNEMLDEICNEISNSIYLDVPFIGESQECVYYCPEDSTKLLVGKELEGFAFRGNEFVYIVKDDKTAAKRFGRYSNPLVPLCSDGKFVRLSSSLLELSFKAQNKNVATGETETKEFKRIINLRNQ